MAKKKNSLSAATPTDQMDLFALMSGLLMVVDELENVSNASRFHHLLSIVCDGLRYKNT